MGGDDGAQLLCLYLEGRRETPDETNLPFLNIRFMCALQNKEKPMHWLQTIHTLKALRCLLLPPKQDVVATFILFPEGSCSANVGQWHGMWLAQP